MSNLPQPTDEQFRFFLKRTNRHIDLVIEFCKILSKHLPEDLSASLWERSMSHDLSKYGEPEFTPYVYLTWKKRCDKLGIPYDYPEDVAEAVLAATEHHVLNNDHHPEAHQERTQGLINPKDRDKPPEEIIDATNMSKLDILEMVADWLAMSEELGTNVLDWADDNVGVRWKFSPKQIDLIYLSIEQGLGLFDYS